MTTLINTFKKFENLKSILSHSITKRTISVFIIQSFGIFLAFLINIWIAKIVSTSEYGQYSFIITLINLLSSIACLGFSSLLVREVPIFQDQKNYGLSKGLIKYSFNAILFSSILFSISIFLLNQLRIPSLNFNTLILSSIIISIPISALLLQRQFTLQGLHHSSYSQVVNNLIKYAIIIIALILFYLLLDSKLDLTQVILINTLSLVLSFILLELIVKKVIASDIRATEPIYNGSEWIKTAIILVAFKLITLLISSSEIFFLEFFRNNKEVAIYSMAKKIAGITSFGLMAANIVLAPKISVLFAQEKLNELQNFVRRSMQAIFAFSLFISLGLIIFSIPLFSYLGEDYKESFLPLIIMIIGELLNVAFGPVANLLISIKQESQVNKIMFITLLFNILSNILLIPLYGFLGAAITTSLTMLCWNLLMAMKVKNKTGIRSWIW